MKKNVERDIDYRKPFSKAKSLELVLNDFGIQDDLNAKHYVFNTGHILDIERLEKFTKELLDFMNIRLQMLKQLIKANEADREIVAHLIVMEIGLFLNGIMNLGLKIASKRALEDDTHTGIMDFCIYKKSNEREKILLVLEVKQEFFSRGSGQLLLELRSVWRDTRHKSWGFVTNALDWILFSYDEVDGKSQVEMFERIAFVKTSEFDADVFARLVHIIVDVILNHELVRSAIF